MWINITPDIVDDIGTFLEYAENIKLANELVSYKPLRRPITGSQLNETERFKRKRKLIARDWFYYAIWASRLKKIVKAAPKLKQEREKKLEEFKKLSEKVLAVEKKPKPKEKTGDRLETEHSGDSEDQIKSMEAQMARMKKKIDEEIAKNEEEKQKRDKKIAGLAFTIRLQDVTLKCFTRDSERIVVATEKKPILELQFLVFQNA